MQNGTDLVMLKRPEVVIQSFTARAATTLDRAGSNQVVSGLFSVIVVDTDRLRDDGR
jgi:hypothetical protein